MRVLVEFCIDADIIKCPDFIIKDLQAYQVQFTEWLYDLNNNHAYWMYEDGKKYGCSYRSRAFVEWLNTFVLNENEEKAKVLEECVGQDGIICRAQYPDDLTDILNKKVEEFKKWLMDKDDKNFCRADEYQKKYGMRKYIGYASVDWLNRFILNERDEQAYVIDKEINPSEMQTMYKIYF